MAKIAIIFDSGTGRTRQVAEKIEEGIKTVSDSDSKLFNVEEALSNLDSLDEFDTMVFGTPTYMGSVSAEFKKFMDSTGQKWMQQKWKDKMASGFTNSGGLNGDKANVMNSLQIFAGQHSMIWISQGTPIGEKSDEGHELNRLSSWNGLMTQTEPKSESPHPADLATAKHFGQRVAHATKRWTNGKS